ncbi:MAG: cupin domain-containing protein [Lachnospiraceae bacterium]|nr:cupin domain-containing protein [Lachnospiraceae bacterium]
MRNRAEVLKEEYQLQQHPEGGWFAEVYTAPFEKEGRPLAGSIYFLLDAGEISHFHQIDCDEIWYFHEGCGMTITMLTPDGKEDVFLGNDVNAGEHAMVVIPKGAIFAAENLVRDGFTFVSCVTTPNFTYEGFRLVNKDEIRADYPEYADEVEYLAYVTL